MEPDAAGSSPVGRPKCENHNQKSPSPEGLFSFAHRPRVQGLGVAQTLESVETRDETVLDLPWVTLVWNDPVNLMTYVSWVFRSYFGFSVAEADKRMLLVHNEGRAVVASGSREEMEKHVEAMHDFGLWATLQKDGS